MKHLFDNDVHLEIMNRLHSLHESNQRLWGTMSAPQMLCHAGIPFEYALGDRKGKQSFIGKILKPFAQNAFFDEKPYKQGLPTAHEFKVINNTNFEAEKQHLLQLIIRFNIDGKKVADNSIHLFLGRITAEQWARTMYKHLDHHFRQFGV